ncbi:MAG TPA: hypothetical protein VK698_35175 [Kofleriaceae bacterium]|nr:hypothetical protein [Kofleriaceae bacterium]
MSPSSRPSRAGLAAAATLLALCVAVGSAGAKEPEDVFRGEIITSAKRIPTTSKSKSAYITTLRKLKTARFAEDAAKKQWKIYFAAFFRTPLNDLEVTIKIYDISSGKQRLLTVFEQYVDKRGTHSLTSQMTLEREQFGVNRSLMMVMENRGHVLAAGRFAIVGQGEKYTGKVDFTEEEAKKPDEDEE